MGSNLRPGAEGSISSQTSDAIIRPPIVKHYFRGHHILLRSFFLEFFAKMRNREKVNNTCCAIF